jgi:hypothetical protein
VVDEVDVSGVIDGNRRSARIRGGICDIRRTGPAVSLESVSENISIFRPGDIDIAVVFIDGDIGVGGTRAAR